MAASTRSIAPARIAATRCMPHVVSRRRLDSPMAAAHVTAITPVGRAPNVRSSRWLLSRRTCSRSSTNSARSSARWSPRVADLEAELMRQRQRINGQAQWNEDSQRAHNALATAVEQLQPVTAMICPRCQIEHAAGTCPERLELSSGHGHLPSQPGCTSHIGRESAAPTLVRRGAAALAQRPQRAAAARVLR